MFTSGFGPELISKLIFTSTIDIMSYILANKNWFLTKTLKCFFYALSISSLFFNPSPSRTNKLVTISFSYGFCIVYNTRKRWSACAILAFLPYQFHKVAISQLINVTYMNISVFILYKNDYMKWKRQLKNCLYQSTSELQFQCRANTDR